MEEHRSSTIAVMARDAGKTEAEADPEVSEAIDFARFYSSCDAQTSPTRRRSESSSSCRRGTSPTPFLPAASARRSPPATGHLETGAGDRGDGVAIGQQLWAGGVPRDVLQFVPTRDDDSGRHLVTHDGVDAVILTGSFDTADCSRRGSPTSTSSPRRVARTPC